MCFGKTFAHRAIQHVVGIRDMWFSGFALFGADSDKSVPIEIRDAQANGNAIFAVLGIANLIILFWHFNFGRGFLWGIAEFLCALLISGPVALACLIILIIAVNGIIALAELAGRGDMIIGTGFFLAACGMAIETCQVWESPYRWAAIAIWVTVMVLVGATLLRR